jgi:dipeptidyl aminopeptidase/acylaminoacyl peptidase
MRVTPVPPSSAGHGLGHRLIARDHYARRVAARDVQALIAELSEWTAAKGRAPQTRRYGTGPDHEADLLLPDGGGPHRVAVLLHGGFWRAGFTRALMAPLAVDLADRGWASWNVEFRRIGSGGGVPETLDDVGAAVEALAHVDAPVDRERLLVIGHSAGGQLALCLAGMPTVAAVISLAGVCDLGAAARERIGESAALEFTGGTPHERPEAYAIADPLRRLPAAARVLLVHGDIDDRVPVQHSRDYARAAQATEDRCELLELAGVDHFALIDPRTPTWAAVAARLDALLA